MIIHSFDDKTEAMFGPAEFAGPRRHFCDVCILTFSEEIYAQIKQQYDLQPCATIRAANGDRPVELLCCEGLTVGVFLCDIGAALAGTDIIDINWMTGATKFIMFGSAGSLDHAATEGKYVLPTEAYRDEGMSYHYAPPADYIKIKNADRMECLFRELDLPYVKGRVWTTDAVYRETRGQIAARRQEGCIAVEMEVAGVQAVCDYHGFELYDFLQTGDILDLPSYDSSGLSKANHDPDKLRIALELAKRL